MHSQSMSTYSSFCIWIHVVDVHDFQVVCVHIYDKRRFMIIIPIAIIRISDHVLHIVTIMVTVVG